MKHVILSLLFILPIAVDAQRNIGMRKYMAGAVPEENGAVVFKRTIPTKLSAQEAFARMQQFAEALVTASGDEEVSRVTSAVADETGGVVAASLNEELYFKRRKWVTDFTMFRYQFVAEVKPGNVSLKIWQITYLYDVERNGRNGVDKAENMITDKAAITSNGRTLRKEEGKFRMKTIDRVEEIFQNAADVLK